MKAEQDRSALVTGVSAGIGANIAKFFLRRNWTVCGLSRRKPEIEDSRFSWYPCDLSDPKALASLTPRLAGPYDAIVHNAASSGAIGPACSLPLETWREAFEVNFFAPLGLTQHILPHCRPNACFIFLSGGGSVTPKPFVGPYAVSKLALIKLAEQLAIEYPSFRFYAMAPGAHDTKLFEEQNSMTSGPLPRFADFVEVERLLETFLDDTSGRLRGKLVHVRDSIEDLLSVRDGGTIRRVERS